MRVYNTTHGIGEMDDRGDRYIVKFNIGTTLIIKKGTEADTVQPVPEGFALKELIDYFHSYEAPSEDISTWNRRYRQFLDDLHSNDMKRVIEVFKRLKKLQLTKDLSFGERKMISKASDLVESIIGIKTA